MAENINIPVGTKTGGGSPVGVSQVRFELQDTDSQIYGNTSVYLVRDCGIIVERQGTTEIRFLSHDDQIGGLDTTFDVVIGSLLELRSDNDFSRATCLGEFAASPATDTLADPPAGDGRYYLARGISSCVAQGYGDSKIDPDPRDDLEAASPCP